MLLYLTRRLAFALFLVFAVSSASLVLTRLAPGDYATESLGPEAHRESIEQARTRYGLDRSIGAQYGDWLARAARLDFGRSLLYDRPVRELIPERAANTAVLAVTALVLATLIGLPLGVLTGSRRGVLGSIIRAASLTLLSTPPLITSLLLIFLAARTGWLPIAGMRSASDSAAGPHSRPRATSRHSRRWRWRCRWRQCSSGCSRRPLVTRWANHSCSRPVPAVSHGRVSSGVMR
jgi:peptide/nickel transport system permease protein